MLGHPNTQALDKAGDGIDLTQPFVSNKLKFRDFALLESACSAEYASFDEYADKSIFPVIVLAKLPSGDQELRKETVAKLTEAARLWGFLKVVNHAVAIDVIRKNLALAWDL